MCLLVGLLCAVQDGRCFYCGVEFSGPPGPTVQRSRSDCWTRDHVIPVVKGGRFYRNIVLACLDCNSSKRHRMPTQAEFDRAKRLHDEVERLGLMISGPGWECRGLSEGSPLHRYKRVDGNGYYGTAEDLARGEPHYSPFEVLREAANG